MSATTRERVALAASLAIIATLLWFWAGQIANVQETLELMAG